MVRSTNSKTRCSLPLRRKTSIRLTMLSCLSCCGGRKRGGVRGTGAARCVPPGRESCERAHCGGRGGGGAGWPVAHLEDANLAQRCLADLLVLVRLLELLDGDDLPRLLVARLEHDAIGAAARGGSGDRLSKMFRGLGCRMGRSAPLADGPKDLVVLHGWRLCARRGGGRPIQSAEQAHGRRRRTRQPWWRRNGWPRGGGAMGGACAAQTRAGGCWGAGLALEGSLLTTEALKLWFVRNQNRKNWVSLLPGPRSRRSQWPAPGAGDAFAALRAMQL